MWDPDPLSLKFHRDEVERQYRRASGDVPDATRVTGLGRFLRRQAKAVSHKGAVRAIAGTQGARPAEPCRR